MMAAERPWLSHYDAGVPADIEYPMAPVFHFLEQAAREVPEQTCMIFQDHAICYGDLNHLADRLSAALSTLGLVKGDRVGISLPNIPQFILAYYAVLKAGGVVVAMNPQYKQRELEYQVADSGVKMFIGLASAYGLLQAVRENTRLGTLILTRMEEAFSFPEWLQMPGQDSDPDREPSPNDWWLRDLILTQPIDARAQVPVGAEDVAILQYSGGTTGIPKGAVGLHCNLVVNTYMFRRWLVGLKDNQEVSLIAIPMYHVYGMVVGLSVSMLLRAQMVLVPDPRDLPDLLRKIEAYQVTFFPGVPTMYALINQFAGAQAEKYDLRSIRACISGSAPLLKEIKDNFERLTGAQLMEGYGLSEAPTATHCNPMFGEKRTGSIGLPLPGVDCRIASLEDGSTDLPIGEIGELLIRSPQVMREYHNRPEDTREAIRDGWLYTGDIARMDADGYFYIVDRKKEMIKVSGFQVWPREIEEVISMHPDVLEAGVAGIYDPIRGEAPKAWVVLKAGKHSSAEDIIRWCEELLVYYKVPVQVEFREALPRTGIGKVLRRELVRQHLEAQG